jgi:hypothetical protein
VSVEGGHELVVGVLGDAAELPFVLLRGNLSSVVVALVAEGGYNFIGRRLAADRVHRDTERGN